MTANELRIGNWVQYMDKEPSEVLQVEDRRTDFYIKTLGKKCYSYYNVQDAFNPIPLTEEWFERFGFEQNADDYETELLKLKFYWNNLGGRYYYVDFNKINLSTSRASVPIKYVHQLQNLYFALTGTELEINY